MDGIEIGTGAAIQLAGVTKRYGPLRAVDDIDLEIAAGEFITLLGPSGSGKTTALMLIAGFERPDAGAILIGGDDFARLPPYRRGIGVVFQSYALFPHMTVSENVGFALKQRGVGRSERDAAVARMLDLVELTGLGTRYPQQLSGGQQQRVAIARAAVFNPRVMLMDEPLSALDKRLRETLQLEIKHLQRRLGITFVYVTHDQGEAMVMSDRVCVMQKGRIEQVGAPRTLYDAPANRFVASFLGEANLSPATVLERSPSQWTVTTGWDVPIAVAPPAQSGPIGLCMVRPERVRIGPPGPVAPGYNAVGGTVIETVFTGDATRYVVQAANGGRIVAWQPNHAAAPRLQPGAAAQATWAVEDGFLLA